MNKWIKERYETLNVYERNVFECFFDIHKNEQKEGLSGLRENIEGISAYLQCKWQRYYKKDIYFKYLEVPITTRCSLNCKECNNLIQVYQKPQNFEANQIIRDIKRICCVSERIKMLRILGGEPLLHPDLAKILNELKKIEKIERVQIVTNGTLLFDKECLALLRHKKFSVDISNYGEHSRKYVELIRQLKKNQVCYSTQSQQKPWKALSSCSSRNRSKEDLRSIFSVCRQDCHSLLNGELHICARSAHGTDLGLIEKEMKDYVSVRNAHGKRELKREIYEILNREKIAACNYCDMFRLDEMETIPSAVQITKKEGLELLRQWKER